MNQVPECIDCYLGVDPTDEEPLTPFGEHYICAVCATYRGIEAE